MERVERVLRGCTCYFGCSMIASQGSLIWRPTVNPWYSRGTIRAPPFIWKSRHKYDSESTLLLGNQGHRNYFIPCAVQTLERFLHLILPFRVISFQAVRYESPFPLPSSSSSPPSTDDWIVDHHPIPFRVSAKDWFSDL